MMISQDDEEELSEIFYTNQKKGSICRVKLNKLGFTLTRESGAGLKKEQVIDLCDIAGGRCIFLKRQQRRLGSCVCSTSSSSTRSVTTETADEKSKTMPSIYESGEDISAYLYVFAYILMKRSFRNVVRRERTVLKLRFRSFDTFEENMQEAERWYHMLKKNKCSSLNIPTCVADGEYARRLLVVLNPKSGMGKARELFHQQVVPVLNEAELQYELHVTKHQNYGQELVHTKNLNGYSGIVIVGGDGIFFEVLNGLLQRTDWEKVLKSKPLGIVPCGSGNGLARSIAHSYNEPFIQKPILSSTLAIISGKVCPMDVVRVELKNQVLYSFLSVGWGFISDIDIESERLRSLGYQRFTIWTLHRLLYLRTYRGKISYKLRSDFNTDEYDEYNKKEPSESLIPSKSCNTYLNKAGRDCYRSVEYINNNDFDDVISLETSVNQSFRSRCDSWFSTGSKRSAYYSISESVYHSIASDSDSDTGTIENHNELIPSSGPSMSIPPLNEPLPESWVVEEGEFVMAHAAYQTHLGLDCFFAPSAKLNDGTIYLIIIRGGISRSQLLNFMIGLSSGTHIPTKNNEFIKVVPVTAFRLEPYENQGIITVDGERIEYGSLQGEILPGIARVMVPK